jgi:hypothetical protein
MNEVLIENWSCVAPNWWRPQSDPYKHEFTDFALGNALHGKVYGHPKIEDGHRAITSMIVGINWEGEDGVLVTTESGTIYKLGAPNPNFCEDKAESSLVDL